MEEGLYVLQLTLEGLKLHPPADTHNLLDLHSAAKHTHGNMSTSERFLKGVAASSELPVLQQTGDGLELRAAGGDGLDAAPQSAVLPHAGRDRAPQSHLTQAQNISD